MRRKNKLFTDKSSANIGFNPRLFLLESLSHLLDGVLLGGFGDVEVGLHGFVVAVAGEFHHDIRRYSVREGEANEGLAASVGANEFVFGFDFVVTDVVFVVCDGAGRVEAADFAEVFVSQFQLS